MGSQQVQTIAQFMPKPDTSDPLAKLKQLLEIAEKVKPKEESESLPALLSGMGEAMQGFAQVEAARLASQGKLPTMPPPGHGPPPPPPNGHSAPPPSPPPPTLAPSEAGDLHA
jgi:hypothetical protein